MRCGRFRIAALACVAMAMPMWAAAPRASAQQNASPLSACVPVDGRWTSARLLCLYRAGVRHDRLDEARTRLRALGGGRPEHPWATLVLAYATQQQDERQAIALYEMAAEGFVHARDAEGEVLARHNLRNAYWRRGNVDAARQHVERALASAEASKQPLVVARADVLEAAHLIESGGDLGRAWRALKRAERIAFPAGPIGLRRTILFNLANANLYLGRLDDAIDALERHRALRAEDGASTDAAMVAFNLLNARLTKNEERPHPGGRERLVAEARDMLAEVQRLQTPAVEGRVHRVLADLLRTRDPDAAAVHLDRCVELEALVGHPELRAGCYWTRSLNEAARDPMRAEQDSRRAFAALAASPGSPIEAFAWRARLRLVWQTMTEDEAIPASLEALDAIERLRAGQPDENTRAELFSNWTSDYHWLAGRLLSAHAPRVSQAFEIGERLRTRVLLERLSRAGVPAMPAATSFASVTSYTPFASFASVQQVQQTLDAHEALLWFSIAPWQDVYGDFGGGAWVVSVTRGAVSVHRLPISLDLHSQIPALVGLLRERDVPAVRWERAASRLGAAILGPVIADLPSGIRSLVIVSDGPLHRLPFDAIPSAAGQPRLGERFEVALVSSATLWLHLRRLSVPQSSRRALILADPELPSKRPAADLRLAPLPWARREARAIARALQLDADAIREGRAASERSLKQTPLEEFAIVHLAAHARADESLPDQSAVFLAADDPEEDGWLRPSEIAALDLRGRVVVLSACDSAEGLLLSGEGPLSLARAFFAGGAAAVVATRWPLRDDDAAFMMERLYKALSSGASVGAALRQAQRDAIGSRRPTAAWAGLVVLGDGRRAPIPSSAAGDRARTPSASWLVTGVGGVMLLGIAALWAVRRR
jgi:CHAT domain-containing protein